MKFSGYQQEVLHRLLDRLERSNTDRAISFTLRPENSAAYFGEEDPNAVKEAHEQLHALKDLGWIDLRYGKGTNSHRIQSVLLMRDRTIEIETALTRVSLNQFRLQARNLLEETAISAQQNLPRNHWIFHWIVDVSNEALKMQVAWDRRTNEIETLKNIASAVYHLGLRQNDRTNVLSWRQFSVKVFSDSKRMDSIRGRIIAILYEYALRLGPLDRTPTDESAILSHFGIQTKEEVILISGILDIYFRQDPEFLLSGKKWLPFLCLPATMATREDITIVNLSNEPLLTVENEETFHSYAHTRKPALYLGGFPSRAKITFLRSVLAAGTRIEHWGDIDCGGIEIFLYLERELNTRILPIHMNCATLEKYAGFAKTLSTIERSRLQNILDTQSSDHSLVPLIQKMLDMNLKLEQEAIEI